MILLRVVYFSVTCLCIKANMANVSFMFIQHPQTYHDIYGTCANSGGVLVMKGEQAFDEIKDAPEVPVSQEFWVGDLLYSDWIVLIDCNRMDYILNFNYMNTSKLKTCYENCMSYEYFTIRENYCTCAHYTFQFTSHLFLCARACEDFGWCGAFDSYPEYVSVYHIQKGVYADSFRYYVPVRVESPSAYGDNYIECVAADCNSNDAVGVMCDAGLQKKGLCGYKEVTSEPNTYVSTMNSCANEFQEYLARSCHNNITNQYVWIGHMRFTSPGFTFEAKDGMIPIVPVARGAKCRKSKMGSTYTVTCIPSTENTTLPYVCKTGYISPTFTTTMNSNGDGSSTTGSNQPPTTDGDGGSTTGIVGGVTGAIVAVVMVIIIVVIVNRRRRKKNQFAGKNSNEASQDPKHDYAMANNEKYYHVYAETTDGYAETTDGFAETTDVYAETTDVYHPYLEILGNDVKGPTSTEYNRNLSNHGYEFPGNSNKGYEQDTNKSTDKLDVDSEGYLDPARTPNLGRKLPEIPLEQTRL